MIFKSEIVFVKIILPIIVGIIIANYFPTEQLLRVSFISLITLIFIATSLVLYYKNIKGWQFNKWIASLFYLVFLCVGLHLALRNADNLKEKYFAKKNYTYLKGWVRNEPQVTNQILRFELKVDKGYFSEYANKAEHITGTLLVALKLDSNSLLNLKYGDELLIKADYQLVEPPYNPAEFNFKAWLATKNVYHQTFIREEQLAKLAEEKGNPIISYALKVRQRQISTYRKLIKDDEAFAVASTLILGYRADLSKETLAAYSKTGTIHALSVSGMHVGIIYIFLTWALAFLDRYKLGSYSKAILIFSLIWYYSLLTGFSPSVLRSAIMLSVFIFAKQLKRTTNSYNIICFTAFCLLIYDPFLLWDVGFQLSFLAVIGLIYLHPKIYKWCYFKNYVLDKIWTTIAISLAAQIATLPLSVYYFHQFPVYFLISNLFILLPITALMYGGIIILILRLHFLAPLFEWLIIFTNKGLKCIADLPYAGITEIWLNQWQLAIFSLSILLLCIALSNKNKKLLFNSIVLLSVLQFSLAFAYFQSTKQQEIIFFSLRKNYAAAFIKGNEAVLITDLAENDKNYEFFVKPALSQHKVRKIELVNWADDFGKSSFLKKGNKQISFAKLKFLLIDSALNRKKIVEKANFNYVWIHGNPKIKLEMLAEEIDMAAVIIDASNRDYVISNFAKHTKNLNKKLHTLKKSEAFRIKIN